MRVPLDHRLIKTLKRGAKMLCEEERELVRSYVRSQMTEDDCFINRGGRKDIYYTMFGWMLSYVLDIKTEDRKRKAYLDSIDVESLDELHKSVYGQCVLLDELLSKGLVIAAISNWNKRNHIEEFFKNFVKHTVGRSLNGEAAKMMVEEQTSSHQTEMEEAIRFILSLQDETGGFMANEGAAMPDLLSTAVALFTLRSKGIRSRYEARDFVEVHINDDGSFRSNVIDDTGDVEYVFYGLLAIGSC